VTLQVLVIGCGNARDLRVIPNDTAGLPREQFRIDIDPDCKPDLLADLNDGLPPDWIDKFDEIHAYEVLEHLGRQGDWRGFFEEFEGYWRVLKPGGRLIATVPRYDSLWAWSDPGHTRIISEGTLSFLSRAMYERDVGKTTMTDYRSVYHGDFVAETVQPAGDTLIFILRAKKDHFDAGR
jgi:SAM-dependent methyltransferase